MCRVTLGRSKLMRSRRAWLPLGCFAIGLAASVAWSCADECDCAGTELTPASLPIALVIPLSEPPFQLPAGLSQGTVEVTETQVIVSYSREGAAYTVTYALGEPTTDRLVPSSAPSD